MSERTNWISTLFLTLGPTAFLILWMIGLLNPADYKKWACGGIVLWVAIWWISEVTPIAITSLLPLIFFPICQVVSFKEIAPEFANETIFLFLGGFIISKLIEKQKVHFYFAHWILQLFAFNKKISILLWMLITAFISMWISNTSTALLMIPMAMAVASHQDSGDEFGKSLVLSIVFASSLGGMATLVGTPTNAIFKGMSKELLGQEIQFWDWFKYGFPISLSLTFCAWLMLIFIFKINNERLKPFHSDQLKLNKAQIKSAIIFLGLVTAWISGSLFWYKWIPGINDTIVVLIFSIIPFLLSDGLSDQKLLKWEEAKSIPWEILLLFGGGLAIAVGIQKSGLADFIAGSLSTIQEVNPILLVLIIFIIIILLSEIASNVATASVVLPVVAVLNLPLGLDKMSLLIGVTLVASVGFALPIATAPNAIGYSTGIFSAKDLLKAGLVLDCICLLLITAFIIFVM